MKILSRSVTERLGWTTGSYAVAQGIRLVNNVILARLLAPELFGIMLIVNTLRTGVELLSDIGIGQNIISNRNGDDPEFYNTAWTLQIIRGVFLSLICIAATNTVSEFYKSQTVYKILPIISVLFIFTGCQSVGIFLSQKMLKVKNIAIYETSLSFISMIVFIFLALYSQTIWSLVFGSIISGALGMIGSFFLLRDMHYKIMISRKFALQILSFGKWIFLSTIVYFLAMNFDRLFLARSLPFQILGIYGVARSLADVPSLLVARIGNLVIFPMVAAGGHSKEILRQKLTPSRSSMLLGAAVFISLFVATSDLVVLILYDDRYSAAARMLPVLAMGIWFSILCTLGESVLLGIGRPSYGAIANLIKLLWLLIGLPIAVSYYGIAGAVCVMAASDFVRYLPLLRSQAVERLSFVRQDILITIAMCAMVVVWRTLFWLVGISGDIESLWGLGGLWRT